MQAECQCLGNESQDGKLPDSVLGKNAADAEDIDNRQPTEIAPAESKGGDIAQRASDAEQGARIAKQRPEMPKSQSRTGQSNE